MNKLSYVVLAACFAAGLGCSKSVQPVPDGGPTLAAARSFSDNGMSVLRASDVASFKVNGDELTARLKDEPPSWQTWADVVLPRAASGAIRLSLHNAGTMKLQVSLQGAAASSQASLTDGYVVYDKALGDASMLQRVTRWGTEDYLYFASKPAEERVSYKVDLGEGVASLRFVGGTLEFLHADGTQGLRMATPYAIDKNGARIQPKVSVSGCNYDSNPSVYARPEETDIGAKSCVVALNWSGKNAAYPLLLDPEWTAPSQLPSGFQAWSPNTHKLASGDVFVAGNSTSASQIWRAASGVWAATGTTTVASDANEGRSTLQNDGNVLVMGGMNGGAIVTAVQLYNVGAGTWSARAAMTVARRRSAIVTLPNNNVLVTGGANAALTAPLATANLYNPSTNTWSAAAGFTTARRDHGLVVLDSNTVLLAGGATNNGCGMVATAFRYSISGNSWSAAGTMTSGIVSPNDLVLSNGRVLMAGSYCNTTASTIYNPATNTWANAGTMGTGMTNLSGQGIAEVGGLVYGPGAGVTGVNQYSVSGASWSAGPTLDKSMTETSVVALNDNRILAVDSTGVTRLLSICGDGVLNAGEACDDGNAASGDGCSATCTVETGFECKRTNIIANGDFELPLNAPGSFTTYFTGQTLGGTGGYWTVSSNSVDYLNTYNGWLSPSGQQCVDMSGNDAGAITQNIPTVSGRKYVVQFRAAYNHECGSSGRARVNVVSGASTYAWEYVSNTQANSAAWETKTAAFTAGSTSTSLTITSLTAGACGMVVDDVRMYDVTALACSALCGNGVVNAGEQCDDGNNTSGDGCSATCTSEPGFSCPRVSSLSNGDAEQPARNNATCTTLSSGDTTTGWTVVGVNVKQCNNTTFAPPTGGQVFELNGTNAGGVSQSFTTVAGRSYVWEARIAQNNSCGVGTKTGYVNVTSGAGVNITTNFSTSTNWSSGSWDLISGSFTAGSTSSTLMAFSTTSGACGPAIDAIRVYDTGVPLCEASCGNGFINAGEACDDGNTSNGDGCSSSCALESGSNCTSPTSLMANGGFETPTSPAANYATYTGAGLTGWTVLANTDVDVVSNGFSGLVSATGTQALDSNGTRTAQVSQSVSTTAGVTYVWSARIANLSAGTRSGAVTLSSGAGNNKTWVFSSSTVANSSNWDTVGGTFTAGSTSSTFAFQSLSGGGSGLYVDDVKLSVLQTCNCNGNFGTGASSACTSAGAPICSSSGCTADLTAACP